MMNENANMPASTDTAMLVASSNFESRKIQPVDNDTLRIKPTIISLAFSLVFIVLGLGLAGLWAARTFTSFDGPGSIPLLLIGVLFVAAGLATYHSSNEQLVINRDAGVAFLRSWHPSVSLEKTSLFRHIQSQDIIAIQTVSRVVKHRSSKNRRRNSYTEYQVNLCTSGAERHNVFITLKQEKAKELGNQLVQLFDVPLWAQ